MTDSKIRTQRGQVVGMILASLRDGDKTQRELVAALPGVNPASINSSLYSLQKQGRVVIALHRGRQAVWRHVDAQNRIIIAAQHKAATGSTITKRVDRCVSELAAIVEETTENTMLRKALREEVEKLRDELKSRLLEVLERK